MMMNVEKSAECLARETQILGENLPPCRFAHKKATWPEPEWNPGRRCRNPATIHQAYGTAEVTIYAEGLHISKSK
jgi:hypothetical protein